MLDIFSRKTSYQSIKYFRLALSQGGSKDPFIFYWRENRGMSQKVSNSGIPKIRLYVIFTFDIWTQCIRHVNTFVCYFSQHYGVHVTIYL